MIKGFGEAFMRSGFDDQPQGLRLRGPASGAKSVERILGLRWPLAQIFLILLRGGGDLSRADRSGGTFQRMGEIATLRQIALIGRKLLEASDDLGALALEKAQQLHFERSIAQSLARKMHEVDFTDIIRFMRIERVSGHLSTKVSVKRRVHVRFLLKSASKMPGVGGTKEARGRNGGDCPSKMVKAALTTFWIEASAAFLCRLRACTLQFG